MFREFGCFPNLLLR